MNATLHRVLHKASLLIERRSLWMAPIVIGVCAIPVLGVSVVRLLLNRPGDGSSYSWAVDLSAVLIASAVPLGLLWWAGRDVEDSHGIDE